MKIPRTIKLNMTLTQMIRLLTLIFALLASLTSYLINADVIMMDGNGPPSIIENDDFEPDVILMPGMSNMLINDDLVL